MNMLTANMQTVMRSCLFAMVALVCGMFCASYSFGAQVNRSGANPGAEGFKVDAWVLGAAVDAVP